MKLKTSHKYYSQVTMLIAIAQARQTYFVLWTTKQLLIEKIEFSAEHWNKQHSTAVFFFRSHVLPVPLKKRILLSPEMQQYCNEGDEVDKPGVCNLYAVKSGMFGGTGGVQRCALLQRSKLKLPLYTQVV